MCCQYYYKSKSRAYSWDSASPFEKGKGGQPSDCLHTQLLIWAFNGLRAMLVVVSAAKYAAVFAWVGVRYTADLEGGCLVRWFSLQMENIEKHLETKPISFSGASRYSVYITSSHMILWLWCGMRALHLNLSLRPSCFWPFQSRLGWSLFLPTSAFNPMTLNLFGTS